MQSVISARPVNLSQQQQLQFPQLAQLISDFGFCLSRVLTKEDLAPKFALFDYDRFENNIDDRLLTPVMDSLDQLETYAGSNTQDLVMEYFGGDLLEAM
ncbi:MAG: hypothetical protein K6L73_14900 [Cellvibrionaceae bacterium]